MSFRKLFIYILPLFLMFISISSAYSQTRVQNADGDWIIIMPDGTWQYDDSKANDPPKVTKEKKTKAKKQKQPKVKKIKKPKTKKAKKPKKTKSSKIKNAAASPSVDRSQLAESEERLQRAKADLNKISRDISAKKKAISATKSEPLKAQFKQELNTLNQSKKLAKSNVKLAKKNHSAMKSAIAKAEKTGTTQAASTQARKPKAEKRPKNQANPSSKPDANISEVRLSSADTKLMSKIRYTPCSVAMREVDPISGQTQINLKQQRFFSYTAPEMRKYMKGSDYLNCYAGLTKIGNNKLLNMTFVINSKLGQKDYGYIEDDASLLIKLIDGTMITLKASKQDEGIVDGINNTTTFKNSYFIAPKQEKELRKYEVSFVRMVWSNGYEDYEVYELDFMIDMFDCLDEAK